MAMKYWLMKSEPDVYSIEHLKKDGSTWWTGVRNYQARNFMWKEMQVGDQVLFYHSNTEPPGIAGIAEICQLAKPDPTQFDKKSEYYEPKATLEKPMWYCTQVKFKTIFKTYIPLEKIKSEKKLSDILVIKKGQRLSVQPVSEEHFKILEKLGAQK